MSAEETARVQALTCPKCGSVNAKPKRSFKSAGVWFGLFVVCLILGASMPYPSVPQLASAWAALAFFPIAVAVAISAGISKNRCVACHHKWR